MDPENSSIVPGNVVCLHVFVLASSIDVAGSILHGAEWAGAVTLGLLVSLAGLFFVPDLSPHQLPVADALVEVDSPIGPHFATVVQVCCFEGLSVELRVNSLLALSCLPVGHEVVLEEGVEVVCWPVNGLPRVFPWFFMEGQATWV